VKFGNSIKLIPHDDHTVLIFSNSKIWPLHTCQAAIAFNACEPKKIEPLDYLTQTVEGSL
jgi:hypothetical protein